MFSKLPSNVLMKNPAGSWSFVGSVDSRLSYITLEGNTPSLEQMKKAGEYGPKLAGVKCRVWPSKDAALEAAKELGLTVSQICG